MADSALRYFVGGKATSSLGRFIGAKTTKHLVNMISASAVHVGQRHLCRSGGVPDCSPRLWWEKSASQQKVMGIDRSRDLTMQGRGTRSISCGAVARKKDDGYISGHVQFEEGKVEDFLKEVGCEYKEQPSNGWLQIKECPDQVCCATPSQISTKHKEGNHYVLGISIQNGAYNCFRCETKGNWHEFRMKMRGSSMSTESAEETVGSGAGLHAPSSSSPSSSSSSSSFASSSASSPELFEQALPRTPQVLRWLQEERGITQQTLEAYRVGACIASFERRDHTCVTFPWFNDDSNQPVRFKLRSIESKKAMRLTTSPDNVWGIFGWNTVTDDTTTVVLTEGEIDALSVNQETGAVALSLPNGAGSLPPALIKMLERFETIILWLDDDAAGKAGVDMCVGKLGSRRCKIVSTRGGGKVGPKDANEAMIWEKRAREEVGLVRRELGKQLEESDSEEEKATIRQELSALELKETEIAEQHSLKSILARQEIIRNAAVLSFTDFRDDVRRELCGYHEAQGIPFGEDLPGLTAILKGHRAGEMSVFTGRTGQGKTTLLSQLSLDLCQQGTRTLWGSFEVQNAKLVAKMMQQQQRANLRGCSPEEFELAAHDFAQLPMWFLKYFGSTKMEHVLDAMDFAVHAHDVKHVILDNLQFMTYGTSGDDKFAAIDDCLAKVRHFATESQVHVSLVMHPRKEEPGKEIHMNSVYGSGKATQDSDNVIILQQIGKLRYLDVQKNRFDGTRGKVPFSFNRETLRYQEISAEEADAMAMEEE